MNWMLFNPELYYLVVAFFFLALSMTKPANPQRDFQLAVVLGAVGVGVCLAGVNLQGDLFLGTYRVDLFSQVFKAMLALGLFLILCLCSELNAIDNHLHPEFYLLLNVCTLAMMMLVSCVHILTIYVALELSSYALYCLVFLRKERKLGIEAGIKYFLVGATASAVMLLGLALLYGATRATYITELLQTLPGMIDQAPVLIGLLMTLGGFFFKLAVFPFHFWAPDAYQGAANQVAAYIATASKVAAVAILTRMVAISGGASSYLVKMLVLLSIISMTLGNLTAIVQKDIKRLFAYSSIAHAGYVLIGILSMNHSGYGGAIFYSLALLLMKFTVFMVVVKVACHGQNLAIDQLAGLHRRSPILALALMMALFGLAGIPPTIGFTGKLLVFNAAMQKGHFALVLIAMINVVISLYYYLMVLKAAYLTEPAVELPALKLSPYTKTLAGVLMAAIVVAGIFPTHLIELADSAARLLL